MKKIFYFLLFNLIVTYALGQKVKKVKVKIPKPENTIERFEVFEDNPIIKNGYYEKYKNKKRIEQGYYLNNSKDSSWKIYNQNEKLAATGKYRKDKKVGIWHFYTETGSLVQQYNYDNDSLVYFNLKEGGIGSKVYPDTLGEQLPIFIGGNFYMHTLLENNTIYPKEAWKKEIEGKAIISFVVDTIGNTTQVKSYKESGFGFDEEAIRVISSFGRAWIPAYLKGKKVSVKYMLPVRFTIE